MDSEAFYLLHKITAWTLTHNIQINSRNKTGNKIALKLCTNHGLPIGIFGKHWQQDEIDLFSHVNHLFI